MKKILVAEDNELNMKLFYDILTYQKFDVTKAYNGLEAYNLIKNNKYDLLILDVMMPELTAFELVEKLNKDKITYPKIIIASACAMDSDKKKASELGINEYITKPIDIKSFIATVQNALL